MSWVRSGAAIVLIAVSAWATKELRGAPGAAPNGKSVAYLGTRRTLTSSETTMEDTHVWLMDGLGGNRRELVTIDNRQGKPQWSPDGSSVYFTVQERGSQRLYRMPVAGGPPTIVAPRRADCGG